MRWYLGALVYLDIAVLAGVGPQHLARRQEGRHEEGVHCQRGEKSRKGLDAYRDSVGRLDLRQGYLSRFRKSKIPTRSHDETRCLWTGRVSVPLLLAFAFAVTVDNCNATTQYHHPTRRKNL